MINSDDYVSIVVPCYNESSNISVLINKIKHAMNDVSCTYEVLMVDDGSSDSTWKEICLAAKENKNIIPLRHTSNRGIVEGWKTAVIHSKGSYILTTDADMQYAPEDIPVLISNMKPDEYDIVQGCRIVHKQKSKKRIFISKIFSLLLNFMFKQNLKDIKSGFVLYKKEAFEKILNESCGFIYFQHFIMIAALSFSFRIKQISVTFYPRFAEQSSITHPLIFSIKALIDVPRALFRFKLKGAGR